MKNNVFIIFLAVLLIPGFLSALNPDHNGCSQCHSLHNAPGQALTDNNNSLCMTCHGAAGPGTEVEVHSGTTYGAFEMSCSDCHNAHDNIDNYLGGTNIKQIGFKNGSATITTPSSGENHVVFTSRGTDASEPSLQSFADGDEDGDGLYEGVCEVCHTQTSHHRNSTSGGDHTHYVGQTCTDCHAHLDNFAGSGGGCTGCHSSAQTGGLVDRRAIVGEFSLTSHHVMGGTVTDDDCGVCHYESTGDHMDGFVDLINPDDGTDRLTPFASFSRTTSSSTIESWATDVQNNMCLKCHDSDGATSTNISGDPMQPFSSNTRDAPNVQSQFSKASHHAVINVGDNDYCTSTSSNGNNITMESPWNQTAGTHNKISCFDCHGASGHGGSNQRMLRTSVDIDSMLAGTFTNGTSVDTFCSLCHKASVYVSGADPEAVGSIFEYHPGGQNQHGSGGGNELGCMGCHGGIIDWSGGSGNDSARGNIHGTNFDWGGAATPVENFIVGGWLSEIIYNGASSNCRAGDCAHTSGQGKSYTR